MYICVRQSHEAVKKMRLAYEKEQQKQARKAQQDVRRQEGSGLISKLEEKRD